MTEEKKRNLARQLVDALQKLDAPIDLLCIVGSFGNTQSDNNIYCDAAEWYEEEVL